MFDTNLVHQVLAAVAGCTLVLAVIAGVSVGASASQQPGGEVTLSAASAPSAAPASIGHDVTDLVTPTTVAAPPAVAPPAVAPPVTAAKVKAPPTTRAPRPAAAPTIAPAPVVTAPSASAPAAVVSAARRLPADAEVQAAISGLVQRVGGILRIVRPTAAQVAQASDQVCTSFDSGQTLAQVQATGLSMIPSSVKVSAATADWAVRTAVSLYCPDHTPKLV